MFNEPPSHCTSSSYLHVFFFAYLHHEETATAKDKHDMLTELNVMKGLKSHPHVLKLIGCCSLSGKLYLKTKAISIASEALLQHHRCYTS